MRADLGRVVPALVLVFALARMLRAGWLSRTPARTRNWGDQRVLVRSNAGLTARAVRVAQSPFVAALACIGAATFMSVPLALLGCVVLLSARRALRRRQDMRAHAVVERALADFSVDLARELRSGHSSLTALRNAALQNPEVFPVQVGLGASDDMRQILSLAVAAAPTPTSKHLLEMLRFGERFGGLRAPFVDAVVSSMRDRSAIRREIRTLSDQAMYSGWVLLIGPLVFAGLLSGTDAGARHFLLQTPLGGALVGCAFLLEFAGFHWMKRLVANVEDL